jgi:hypothetical protein
VIDITIGGVLAALACLVVAVLPLPRRAEGVRIGFFSSLMAYVFVDAITRRPTDADLAAIPALVPEASVEEVALPVDTPTLDSAPVDTTPVAEEDRLSAIELLTGFSVLRHLRRTGAVSDREYDAKKADILRRV